MIRTPLLFLLALPIAAPALAADQPVVAVIPRATKAVTMFPGQGYIDSGYPDCTISTTGAASGDASCTAQVGQ